MLRNTALRTGSYRTVTEVEDWGPMVTKLIVDIGRTVPVESVAVDTFKVHVVRSDSRLDVPVLEEGHRNVTKAYMANAQRTAYSYTKALRWPMPITSRPMTRAKVR